MKTYQILWKILKRHKLFKPVSSGEATNTFCAVIIEMQSRELSVIREDMTTRLLAANKASEIVKLGSFREIDLPHINGEARYFPDSPSAPIPDGRAWRHESV